MLRGYRIYIVALGLVLAGAQQPPKQADANGGAKQQRAPASPIATPPPAPEPTYRPYPKYDPDPCYRAEHHDTADLCAQWRAAIAAEKAAHEARRATNWAIVATLLSVATIFGLIFSLYQTHGALGEARRGNRLNLLFEKRYRRESRKAAEDQERALAIAESQLQISERSSKANLRAYLVVDRIVPIQYSGDEFSAKVFVKNVGQTPARINQVSAIMWISEESTIGPHQHGPGPRAYHHFINSLAHGAEDMIWAVCKDVSLAPKLNDVDKADIYVYGRVEFTDVFGDAHWMEFAQCPAGWGYNGQTQFRTCINGNDSD